MKRVLFVLLALALCACDSSATQPPTISVGEPTATLPPSPTTAPYFPTSTPQPGFTLIPNTALPPTETPQPCTNDAVFTADVTVPDNSEILPGAPIDKRWKIQNTGTCNWDARYTISFFEGNQMTSTGEFAIYPAKAGTPAVLQVSMVAPDVPGNYTGRWQLRDPDGKPFGPVLFIKIVVIPLASPTPGS